MITEKKTAKWEIVNIIKNKQSLDKQVGRKSKIKIDEIINTLLENRGIRNKKQKDEFFKPTHPSDLKVKSLGIDEVCLEKAIKRVKKAIKNDEQIIIYGDYDADGICATAILWETLYSLTKNALPFIPDRFNEGYGIKEESVNKVISQNPDTKLIITVDNGIVAANAVDAANKLGIDVIVTDHHQKGEEVPDAHAIIHTTKISGSGVAWIFAREIKRRFDLPSGKAGIQESRFKNDGLDLAAIGTIADQMPLIGPNRSFAKYGLEKLGKTKRKGLLALFREAGINTFKGATLPGASISTYEVNFVIAPRLNAMGRLEHAIDSLRLLCTKNSKKASELADVLGDTNKKRQKIVDEVVAHARVVAQKKTWQGAIVLSHKTYHEGVIGLAAAKLVEEFGRPAIVFSEAKKISKASARSISGFDIIESIKSLEKLTLGCGGHPMAAGFSIETNKIDVFKKEYRELTSSLLTEELLTKRIKIDMEIEFASLNDELMQNIEKFEPYGIGNPQPLFASKKVKIVDIRRVGNSGKHLKLYLENEGFAFDAIAFGKADYFTGKTGDHIDIAYNLIRDQWNGNDKLQLRVKEIQNGE